MGRNTFLNVPRKPGSWHGASGAREDLSSPRRHTEHELGYQQPVTGAAPLKAAAIPVCISRGPAHPHPDYRAESHAQNINVTSRLGTTEVFSGLFRLIAVVCYNTALRPASHAVKTKAEGWCGLTSNLGSVINVSAWPPHLQD